MNLLLDLIFKKIEDLNLKSFNTNFNGDGFLNSCFLALYLKKERKEENIVIYARNSNEITRIYNFLTSFINKKEIIIFPSDELIRVEYLSSSKDILAEQIYAINEIIYAKNKIILASPTGIFRFLPSKETFLDNSFNIKVGDNFSFEFLKEKLILAGYTRVNKIDQSLQFAFRGDIIDIFPINIDNPIRIEFFGDEVESIRSFDIGTQTSISKLDQINILPATLNLLTLKEKENIKEKILSQFNKDKEFLEEEDKMVLFSNIETDLSLFESDINNSKIYKYIGFLQCFHFNIQDFLNNYTLIITNEVDFNNNTQLIEKESIDFLFDLEKLHKTISKLVYYNTKIDYKKGSNQNIIFKTFLDSQNNSLDLKELSLNNNHFNYKDIINLYKNNYEKIIFSIDNNEKIDIIKNYLEEIHFDMNKYNFIHPALSEGFEFSKENVVVLTTKELFNKKKENRSYVSRFKEGIVLDSYLELEEGDYVVHETYGIGQFSRIYTIIDKDKTEDYIELIYDGGNTLSVPLTKFNMIRKYVSKEGKTPKLNRLFSKQWQNTKQKIKDRVNDLAERLLILYQNRNKEIGFKFSSDNELQESFENEFEYELTKDQFISLNEIKKDMESDEPMDRLLCGDVGFGKTEVAFRAAFKAILDLKQVAILCPTTLLARQHYELAKERFKNFDVRIELLTRKVTKLEEKVIKYKLQKGEIDIIIGTHKILSKDVIFNDLALLIIDEEQRFGVEQKEKIKERKTNIDVLTLSATPIPRTLQTSLVGLKNVSTINTPPKTRIPIQTYVIEYDLAVIKELIERELNRNGQVFYIHNDISTIYNCADKLSSSIPNAKIGVIHAKMNREVTEEIMTDFYNNDLNVLVATTIIENGIDVTNANLIIVENADRFGLSQLYQIKGRVGRGDRMAFAYLLVKDTSKLTEESKKRLKAIQDFTELGSGFKIAQRDLLIRGAGDLLGPEQAGFIDSVGVDMYIKLLNEAISEKKSGIRISLEEKEQKRLDFNAYIPDDYATKKDKVELYQSIIKIKTLEELENFKLKLLDMYGNIPLPVLNLIKKQKINIYIEFNEIDDFKEYENRIDVYLSRKFSKINGIGSELFNKLLEFVNKLKLAYIDRKIVLQLTKKDEWPNDLIKMFEIIHSLYEEKRNDEN